MPPTLLTSAWTDTTDTAHLTAPISPMSGRLYIAAVVAQRSGLAETPTLSGAGLSWQFVNSRTVFPGTNPRHWITVFKALADANATAGQITINFGVSVPAGWAIFEYADGDDVVQSVVAGDDSNTAELLTLTLAQFADPSNSGLAFFLLRDPATQSADPSDSTWQKLLDQQNPPPSSRWGLAVYAHDGEDTTITSTWTGQTSVGGIALEIRAASGTPPTFNPAWAARSTITLQPGRAA